MQVPNHERRIQTICLLILTAIAIAAALYWLKPVMIPFVLAYFFVTALNPLIDYQTRKLRVPRMAAIGLTFVLGALIFCLLWVGIAFSVGQLQEHKDAYMQSLKNFNERVSSNETIQLLKEKVGIDETTIKGEGTSSPLDLQKVAGKVVEGVYGIANAIIEVLSKGFLVIIFAAFLLVGGQSGKSPGGIWGEIQSLVRSYIVSKTLLSLATGALITIVFFSLNVKLALVFGLFAFLLNYIPSIGSIIATLLPLPVVLLDPDLGTASMALAFVLPMLIQVVIGNVLEPRILGSSLDLHPIVLLMSLIFWGMLWGAIGMLLATPITSVLKILLNKLELTAPIGDLLAGRLDTPDSSEKSSSPAG